MGTVVVRVDPRVPGAAERIVEVQRAAYAVEAALIGFRAIPPLAETADDVRRLDLDLLGAVAGGRIVAVLGYRRLGDTVDVDRLAVDPACFRQGHARRLLEHLHGTEDAAVFTVSTGVANTPAVRLYAGLGYRTVGERQVAAGLSVATFERRYGPGP